MTTLTSRFYHSLKQAGILKTQQSFSEKLGWSRPYANQLIAGVRVEPRDIIEQLEKAFPENKNLIASSQVEKVATSVFATGSGEGVPVFDIEFAGGERANSFFWEGEHPIAYMNIPEVFGCDAIIRARGESMSPKINPRDWVGIREIKDFRDFLPYGHIYGVETEEFGLFKYVRKSKDPSCIHLVSEDADYEPQDLELNKVIRLWQVRVVIPISQILLLA